MTAPATSRAAAQLLDEAVARLSAAPSLTAVERLARWLARSVVSLGRPTCFDLLGDLTSASEQSRRTGEGVVLAEAATGHVMVVRYFPSDQPTPIHGHGGWGAVVVLRGHGRYETWEPTTDGFAHLVDTRDLAAGDTMAWPNPPHDVHRQVGLDGGATELTIFARHPFHTWAPQFQPAGEPHIPQPRLAKT